MTGAMHLQAKELTEDCQQTLEVEGNKEGFSIRTTREHSPADTLISDSLTLEIVDNTFLLF